MAISTYKTFLMHKGSSENSYTKLCDITSFPDMGDDPETLDTTTLSDKMKTWILGIQSTSGLIFAANYDKSVFTALKALEGETEHYAVWLGGTESGGVVTPDGTSGKFTFDGQLSVRVTGGGVNEVVGMSIMIAPTTVIDFA